MFSVKNILIAAFFVSILGAQRPTSQITASVAGTVTGGNGNPVSGANVQAILESDYKKQFSASTDLNGRFAISDLPAGTFFLQASKESDGYPESFYAFFSRPGMQFPSITLKPGEALSGAVIKLGAKAARINLDIGSQDGKPLDAALSFSRPDMNNGSYSIGVNSKTSLLVPPVPFKLTVESNGYKPWHYAKDSTDLVSLKSGQVLDITVRLKPTP